MTASSYVPPALHELREYLKPKTGLDNISIGIVNNETDASYHHGWSQRDTDGSDYSWDESPRDWTHKTNAARALDIGMFDRLRELSLWLVGECQRGAPDCADIREIIYSPDGKVVKRWDRLGIRTTGGSSHLTHTHVSWFADAEHNSKVGPFKRFFGDDTDMDPNQDAALKAMVYMKPTFDVDENGDGQLENRPVPFTNAINDLAAAVAELKETQSIAVVDQDAVNAAVAAALSDPAVVAAIATAVNDEAHRRSAE